MRFLLFLLIAVPTLGHASYAGRPEVDSFVRELAERHGWKESELKRVFAKAQRLEPVLEAIARPAERVKTWDEYRTLLITERRVTEGIEFWKKYRNTLERAEKKYGVPPEYVVAIIGVETFYGRNTGNWRVVDALTTLAFDYPPRAGFFRSELESYLLMAREAGIDVFSVRGSYAGAIGIPQFMPSSARRYAVDFDGNGRIDLQKSRSDAIGSVANFLKVHGWQRDADVLVQARVRRGLAPVRERALRAEALDDRAARGGHRVRFTRAGGRHGRSHRASQRTGASERVPYRPAQLLRDHALQPQPDVRNGRTRSRPGSRELHARCDTLRPFSSCCSSRVAPATRTDRRRFPHCRLLATSRPSPSRYRRQSRVRRKAIRRSTQCWASAIS
jgi:lytic murein transglycosylase B